MITFLICCIQIKTWVVCSSSVRNTTSVEKDGNLRSVLWKGISCSLRNRYCCQVENLERILPFKDFFLMASTQLFSYYLNIIAPHSPVTYLKSLRYACMPLKSQVQIKSNHECQGKLQAPLYSLEFQVLTERWVFSPDLFNV